VGALPYRQAAPGFRPNYFYFGELLGLLVVAPVPALPLVVALYAPPLFRLVLISVPVPVPPWSLLLVQPASARAAHTIKILVFIFTFVFV
jgi:hypothetical protein